MNQDERNDRPAERAGQGTGEPSCFPSDTDNGIVGDTPLAMVYAPKQYWRALCEPAEALRTGTMFRELYFPLEAIGGEEAES